MSFTRKLLILGVTLTIVPLALIFGVVTYANMQVSSAALQATVDLAKDDLDDLVQSIYLSCQVLSRAVTDGKGADANARGGMTDELLNSLASIKVGKTGYIYILTASGPSRGTYVLSAGRKRDGENIWDTRDADGKPVIQAIVEKASSLSASETGELSYPWKNTGDAAAMTKIARFKYVPAMNWVVAASLPEAELLETSVTIEGLTARARQALIVVSLVAVALGAAVWWFVSRKMTRDLTGIVSELTDGAQQVVAAAQQVAASAQTLSQGATDEAASLEETASSMEEMASMTRRNAENSSSAATCMEDVDARVSASNASLAEMVTSMRLIEESSNKVSKIIKTIDEIAFQTNILALNAAVEAARAGEAGLGFAVVAEEVRNLAQRSAGAAKDTAALIEESLSNSKRGAVNVAQVGEAVSGITLSVRKVKGLVDEVSAASTQQAQGIDQVSQAVARMEKVTQSTAATAEESAAASEELSAQANTTLASIHQLKTIVSGTQAKEAVVNVPATRRSARPAAAVTPLASWRKTAGSGDAEAALPLEKTGTYGTF